MTVLVIPEHLFGHTNGLRDLGQRAITASLTQFPAVKLYLFQVVHALTVIPISSACQLSMY